MADAGCQLEPQRGLSTEAPTYDLPKWLGLPRSIVASGRSHLHDDAEAKKTCASQAFYDAGLEVTGQPRHFFHCVLLVTSKLLDVSAP